MLAFEMKMNCNLKYHGIILSVYLIISFVKIVKELFAANIFFSYAVQTYPCDSNPCQNGGQCKNDPKDVSKYRCVCPKWFVGDRCEGMAKISAVVRFALQLKEVTPEFMYFLNPSIKSKH